jgi:hypothetical protein
MIGGLGKSCHPDVTPDSPDLRETPPKTATTRDDVGDDMSWDIFDPFDNFVFPYLPL